MAPTLHLLRHGQGHHATEGEKVRDAVLTDKGRKQCKARCEAFPDHDKIELLLASPLRRTLQTCSIVFQPCLDRGMSILAFPNGEECTDNPCDTGTALSELEPQFPASQVDFSLLHGEEWGEEWFKHSGRHGLAPKELMDRAAALRKWVKAREEKEVVLVAHGNFNHFITGEVNEKGEQTTGWWREAECRTYDFVDGDEDASLKETSESVKRREQEVESEKAAEQGKN